MAGPAEVEEREHVEAAPDDTGHDGTGRENTGREGSDPGALRLRERAAAQIPKVVHTGDPDDDEVRYERSPSSALRLITSVLLGLVVLGLAELLPQTSIGLERDLQRRAGTWAVAAGELAN